MAIRGVGSGGPISGGGGSEQITHTVQKGETLDGIAQQHGVNKKDLIKENPQIEGAAKLKAGMQLNIPAARGGATVAKAPAKDTFESSARRGFADPVTDGVKLPKFGDAHEAKHRPVTLRGEAFAQKFQRGEGAAQKHSPGEAYTVKGEAAAQKHSPGEVTPFKGDSAARKFRGEAARFKGEAVAQKYSPGEAYTVKGEAAAQKHSRGEAGVFKGETRVWGDPHVGPDKIRRGEAERFKGEAAAQKFSRGEAERFKGDATAQKLQSLINSKIKKSEE